MTVEAVVAAAPAVTGAIRKASRMTGADFRYLLATAQVESNLNPNAAPKTSSARGLFQFVEQTWLQTMKEQGAALGYGRYASAIDKSPAGQYEVGNPRARQAILNLRSDPAANAALAGAFTKTNAVSLTESLGRTPSEGELYIGHFLGAVGAGRLINMAQSTPQVSAAAQFPSAARANPTIFFDKGRARGAAEVYGLLVNRYDTARGPDANVTQVAKTVPAAPTAPARPMPIQDTAKVTAVYATASADAKPVSLPGSDPDYKLGDSGPAFHGLFHSGPRAEAVSPTVSALWNVPTPVSAGEAGAPAAASAYAAASPERPAPLDLFQEQGVDARALFRGRIGPN